MFNCKWFTKKSMKMNYTKHKTRSAKNAVFWDMLLYSLEKCTDVSEECSALNFRVKE
jgi:hypothetical protein